MISKSCVWDVCWWGDLSQRYYSVTVASSKCYHKITIAMSNSQDSSHRLSCLRRLPVESQRFVTEAEWFDCPAAGADLCEEGAQQGCRHNW